MKGSDVEHRPHDGASATNGSTAEALAAVARYRRKTGESSDATSIDPTELRQLGDESRGHDGSDTRHGLQPAIDFG